MPNFTPKISIITITFNAEKYLERTILSVINQTYFNNIEYLIIDGKSSDKTLEIVQKYAHQITKIISEPDKGLYDAMNKGIALATGTYIWFMNAGDQIFEPQTLQKALENSQNADFIYGKTSMLNEETGATRSWYKTPPQNVPMSYQVFINGMVVCHQAMLLKRQFAPLFCTDLKVSADLDWCIKALKNMHTFYDTQITLCCYLEGGISEKNRLQSWNERFWVLKTHFGFAQTLLQHCKIAYHAIGRKSIG